MLYSENQTMMESCELYRKNYRGKNDTGSRRLSAPDASRFVSRPWESETLSPRLFQLRAIFTTGDGLKKTGDGIDFEKLRQKRKTQTTPTHKKHPTNDTDSMTGRTTTPRHPGTQPPTKPESYRRTCVNDHLQRGLKDRLQEYMDTGDA